MTKKKYEPNFNDPRVRSRIIQAIAFVKQYLREDRAVPCGTREIDKHLGKQSNPLSKYLREQLLVCVDNRYNKDLKITKKYRLNALGLTYITSNIDVEININQQKSTEFAQELAQGIQYNHKSDRQYHWLQNVRRDDKRNILAANGLIHNYDIVCSCPSLLLQHSQHIPEILNYDTMIKPKGQQARPKWQQGPMDQYLFYVNDYLKNRKSIRARLAQLTGQDVQKIKRALNGLFQGGHINKSRYSKTLIEFDYNTQVIDQLRQDPFVQGLTNDIKLIWEYIQPTLYQGRINTRRGVRNSMITGKQKTALYRQLESRVLKQVDQYLINTNNEHYLEHDGWTTRKEIDINELIDYVKTHTGFVIDIDYELLSPSTSAQQTTA